MKIFSTQVHFDGNLDSTYFVKLFFVCLNILGRRDWTDKNDKQFLQSKMAPKGRSGSVRVKLFDKIKTLSFQISFF